MPIWGIAVLAVLGAAVSAGCIFHVIVTGPTSHYQAPGTVRLIVPKVDVTRHDPEISTSIPTDDHVKAYQRAVDAILKRAENAKASAGEPPSIGRVPLPKKRPIPR